MKRIIGILIIVVILSACERLVEVPAPSTQLIRETVFEDDLTATSSVSALYVQLTNDAGGFNGISYLAGLSADELFVQQDDEPRQFYQNNLLSVNSTITSIWTAAYSNIYKANAVVEGLANSQKVSPEVKNQLMGEALFFRAFQHFYLVTLFGDVPYVTTTDYLKSGLARRLSVTKVYEQIILDLNDAKNRLSSDYSLFGGSRVRVNKWAAAAMLARVYLYTNNWSLSEAQADEVIGNTSLFTLLPKTELSKVFLKNSLECIWQLIPPVPQLFTSEGSIFNRGSYDAATGVMTNELFNAFNSNDLRKTNWTGTNTTNGITYHFPLKYKENANTGTGVEYSMVLRLAEQYLIRAETRARQNKLSGAIADLNLIRGRAGLPATVAGSQDAIIDAVMNERRFELFNEWGHRWLDLKRTGRTVEVLSPIKPSLTASDLLYPIPYTELQLNPNLIQNPNY